MIRGVLPRQHGTYREGGRVATKFIFTTAGAAPVIAIKAERGNVTQPAVAALLPGNAHLARTGIGLYTLTLGGGSRQSIVDSIKYLNKAGAFANCIRAEILTQNDQTGVYTLAFVNSANPNALADSITNNDELHVVVYTDK